MRKSAAVFVQRNADGSFVVGVEDSRHAEAIRTDASGLLDLIWQARRVLREAGASEAAAGGDDAYPAGAGAGRP